MKVLLSDITYSYLFPGGKQVHAEKLYKNISKKEVDIEYENWHDPNLTPDLVHFLGYNDFNKIDALKKKGVKLVYTHIMDGLTNLPEWQLKYHTIKNFILNLLPLKFNLFFPWRVLSQFDAIVYMHENDRNTALRLYNIKRNKTFIIPHAVESLETFTSAEKTEQSKEKYLISLGSIVERKNAIFTAQICKQNGIKIKFVGHPFDSNSKYYREFINNVDSKYVQYYGYCTEEEKVSLLKNASGFVLLSHGESGCISVYEAAATGLPLLLSDLPWAKGYENPFDIKFCSPTDIDKASRCLSDFYLNSIRHNRPSFDVHTWEEIAQRYVDLYKSLIKK